MIGECIEKDYKLLGFAFDFRVRFSLSQCQKTRVIALIFFIVFYM